MIKYTNISINEYISFPEKEKKAKPYCIEYSNGTKKWIINRKLHHEDGPAIIWDDGSKFWYLNDIEYSFEEFLEKTPISDEEKIFLRFKYGN